MDLRQDVDSRYAVVYSNIEQVELFVNGKKVAGGRPGGSRGHQVWPAVALRVGTNDVRVSGTRDGQRFEDRVTWTRVQAHAPGR